MLARLLGSIGYHFYVGLDYQSLIRGGHNFCRVSFARDEVWCDHRDLDFLIALNESSVAKHLSELNKEAVILAEEGTAIKWPAEQVVFLPSAKLVQAVGGKTIMRATVFLGALVKLWGLDFSVLEDIFKNYLTKSVEINLQLAKHGFDLAPAGQKIVSAEALAGEIFSGNEALALGLAKAGLNWYFGYPMTPSTTIHHYLAKNNLTLNVKTIQPENEIAVINMAVGAAAAGARVAVGTSGGGFDLMAEGLSFAGMVEAPLVVALSQRSGPSTGVPTYPAQADLLTALFSGHGEWPKLVVAPGDPAEAAELSALAMNLALKYQTPAIVLLDQLLSENSTVLHPEKIKIARADLKEDKLGGEKYGRYQITADGISPWARFGLKNTMVKWNSYEHDEQGFTTEEPEAVRVMQEKRMKKMAGLTGDTAGLIKVYGDPKAKTAVIFWGGTKAPILEATKYLKKAPRLVQVQSLRPLPVESLKKSLSRVKKIAVVENNFTGQLARHLKAALPVKIDKQILKYDARGFDPLVLAEKLNKFL